MPVRVRAKPPGEFIRDHMVDVGGMDYPQSIFNAYKLYLKTQGLKDGLTRATMSHYIYLANRLGLIQFDHAESPSRWDGLENGFEVPEGYKRERRPFAPSPRHYYRILDPTDDRWIRLEASYRSSIGLEVGPMAPRPPIRPPAAEEAPPPVKKAPPVTKVPPKAKVARKPRVKKVAALTPEEKVQPYEERVGLIVATLGEIEASPSEKLVIEVEGQLLDLGEEVVAAAGKARGTERTILSNIVLRSTRALDEMPLLRSSVDRVLASQTDAERERNMTALRAATRVLREEITTLAESPGGE